MSDLLIKMPLEYEPLKKNRFLFRFPSDLGIQEWWVATGSRPTISQNEVEIPFLNTSNWVIGRYIWEAITITLRDPIGPSASQAVMEWVRLHSESVTGRQGYAVAYKRDIVLEMLDPTGVVVEKWIIEGAYLTGYDGGTLAYSSDAIAGISSTIQMDRCILVY